MTKLLIKSALARGIEQALGQWDIASTLAALNKALGHKYIRRWPAKSGKGWDYLYPRDLLKPLLALKTLFGFKEEKIADDYEKNNIQQDYGADKKTFAAHVLEYFSNKLQWDRFFSKKEVREKYKKPEPRAGKTDQKTGGKAETGEGAALPGAVVAGSPGGGNKDVDGAKKNSDSKGIAVNRSLMRKIWGLYSGQGGTDGTARKDNPRTGSGELPAGSQAVRAGGSEEAGDQHGVETVRGAADNGGNAVQLPLDAGEQPHRDVRITKKQAQDIRQACLDLLHSKSDSEMTEEDKHLLRQYEGAGGLGSEDASANGTLYEFYTPRTVTKKVWEIVDKYIPGKKSVLEPSAGIGRFAEDRPNDTFTLNEYDATSSRISGILHPGAEIKHGAFQELFKPGKPYAGKKYDVVIGNPPYGAYEGIWKGRGEGKGHTRYEEYFIERGLDTLREGGVMAFVVPSGFLRSGASAIKEKIAGKGRLLEAWRLPNGTFNTTGVGTDMVIIRKEKGDPAQFSDNAYFASHPEMVAGDETVKTGRFGKEEKYVGLKEGVSFDEAIEGIKADAVEAVPIGERTTQDALEETVAVKESEAEKRRNRSEAMRGNDNAKKDGPEEQAKVKGSLAQLSDILSSGNSQTVTNAELGEITVDKGHTGKGGYGLSHIIASRAAKDGLNEQELTALLYKVVDAAQNGKITQDQSKIIGGRNIGRIGIEKDGIIAFISRIRDEKDEKFVITGFALDEKKEEAADAIQTVIAQYGYTPEFSYIRKQVGAVVSSLDSLSPNADAKSRAMLGNDNAAGAHDTDTAAEFNAKYNKRFDPRDLRIMRHTLWNGELDTAQLSPVEAEYLESSGNYVAVGDGAWISAANYASGNIYQRLDALEASKAGMTAKEYQRRKGLLEDALPVKKTVFEFTVSPLSDFAEEYSIGGNSASPTDGEGGESLNRAFTRWVQRELGPSAIPGGITKQDILDYVNRKSVRADGRAEDKTAAQLEKMNTVRVRRETAERLFNQFIREQLPMPEQERMADQWNRRFNGTVQPDHTKIPAFVDGISKTFKGKPLKVSDIQLKGVGTLVNRGNGILAYDVGVGKTMAGILATVSQIQTGRAKRPLICVPKAVYKNWISEIKQLFPGMKINELGNLRALESYKNADGSLAIPEGSLSVCTYEGLQAISFKQETIDDVLMADFMESQQATDGNDSQRKQAQELERIRTALGKSTKSTDNAVLWEDTGFDHITFDEMHNFKNVFGEAKAKEKGDANEFQGLSGGTPSDRAMKAFAITQLIQRDNNGRNVFGLTATPFTNSPIEIYNILSLVARDELKNAGIFNLHEFMAQFALLKTELAQTAKGDVEVKTVMREFKNLSALQNLINAYIDKVDGDEAGVIRPNKTAHLVEISMTADQKKIYENILEYMDKADPKEDPGATLRGLNALRALTVSPALLNGTRFVSSYLENSHFVESSPKMTFVCDAVTKLYKDDPKAGQVIYLPEGIGFFKDVKQYLAQQGIPEDAVAFLSPEYLPSGDKGNDRKEEIMAEFNDPEGKIKVIIGSGTIKEGVNLNGNTTTLYNCMLGWNPTETVQVEGRIHRQGNKQGEVHIVYPLMNDTVDSFMYQKHYEKSKRISAVFSYKGDTLNVEDINPEELRFNLIKDPEKRADLQIKQEVEAISGNVAIAQAASDKIMDAHRAHEELVSDIRENAQSIDSVKQAVKALADLSDEGIKKRYGNKYDEDDESFDVYINAFSGSQVNAWIEAKDVKEFRREYEKRSAEIIKSLQKQIASAKGKAETLEATLERYQVTPGNEASALRASKKYGTEAAELKQRIEQIRKNKAVYTAEARKQLEAYAKERPGQSVAQAVDGTTVSIKGNLRPMEDVEKEIRAKREAAAEQAGVLQKAKGQKKLILKMKRGTARKLGLL